MPRDIGDLACLYAIDETALAGQEALARPVWLKNLPPLVPTNIVEGREPRVHHMSPGPDRWKERSRFFPGIAEAMADQWGGYALESMQEAA